MLDTDPHAQAIGVHPNTSYERQVDAFGFERGQHLVAGVGGGDQVREVSRVAEPEIGPLVQLGTVVTSSPPSCGSAITAGSPRLAPCTLTVPRAPAGTRS
jgi:acyl CoA:acetate/3-ketoacid CoA transferase beta subunit